MSKDKYMDDELLANARKPEGKLGSKLIECMNKNHEGLSNWSLGHIDISKDDIILDIGCGGGANIKKFLENTENKVYGIDYSNMAVEKSKELNKKAIGNGRCEIIHSSVSNMPFDNDTFDIITAFESVYFWPDFTYDLKEVKRVLKKDGLFLIANEAQPKENDERQKHIIELLDMNIYSKVQLEQYLHEAGFSNVKTYINKSKDSFTNEDADWICIIAKK